MSRRVQGVRQQVESGLAELLPDPDRPGGWTLRVDGTPQSYVDSDDPRVLVFEYMRRLGSAVDAAAPAGEPLRVLHLGGGALTLPRYVAATRPGSAQQVVERDATLIALVRRELPLPRGARIRVRAGDARDAVEAAGAGRYDLVVTDVYGGARVPARFTSTEFAHAVARVLHADGLYTANLADGPPLSFARAQVATLRAVFPHVCLLAEPAVLRGRRFGNVILVAGRRELPLRELGASAVADAFPARLVHGEALVRFTGGARPVDDASAVDSPLPPAGLFTRR
jgi:spermidine synthase